MTARSRKSSQPKDNAKGRRKKENTQLLDLASQLPLPSSVASQLDKASVIRLATAYLKLRKLFPKGLGREWGESCSSCGTLMEMGKFLNKALHGFVFVLGPDATILYISEEASAQLGYSQVQLTGKNFWSYVHSTDAKELKSILYFGRDIPAFNIENCAVEDVEIPRSFAIRMRCILPKRQAELAIDRYKVIHCRGYLKLKRKELVSDGPSDVYYEVTGVVAAGHSLSPTPSAEIKLYRRDFIFRTSLGLKFLYIEPWSQGMIGYEPLQLQNKSLYKFIHPYDCKKIEEFHMLTLKKSQAVSSYYRFLTQSGGWVWMQSSCIVVANSKADREQCILFMNSVLSERECPNRMLDLEQLSTPECNLYKKSHAGYKKKRKTPYQLLKELSTIHATISNSSQQQSSPYQTSKIQVSDKMPKIRSAMSNSPSPESVRSGLQSNLLESRQSVNEYQNHDQLQKDNFYGFNHDGSVARDWAFGGVNRVDKLEAGTNLPSLQPNELNTTLYESSLTKYESSLFSKFFASADDCRAVTASVMCNTNQVLESGHVSPVHMNNNLTNEHVACYSLPNKTNVSSSELDTFLHSNIPIFADGNQSDSFSQNSTETSLPFGSWHTVSQKSFFDLPSVQDHNFNLDARLSGSANESVQDVVTENNEFAGNYSVSASSMEGDVNGVGFVNFPISLPLVDSKNGNFTDSPNQECTNAAYESEFTVSSQLPCYGMTISEREECNELNSKMTASSEDIPAKLEWCNTSGAVPVVDSMSRNIVTSSAAYDNAAEYRFNSTSGNQTFNASSANENNQLNDIFHPYNNVLPNSSNVEDLLATVSVKDERAFNLSRNQMLESCHIQLTSEISKDLYSMKNLDGFHNSHYSNASNATLQRDEIPAEASAVLNPDITVYNHTKNVCALPNSNHCAAFDANQTSSKAALIGINDYRTSLSDQLKAMHPQSTPNVRSDSVSSMSLGYASESSCFDQSSPFSTYGESPFS